MAMSPESHLALILVATVEASGYDFFGGISPLLSSS